MKLKIKKGANVEVITGKQKGTRGIALDVDRNKMRIKVQGVRVQTHFDKKEGIQHKEGYLHYSNVKLVAPTANSPRTSKKAAGTKSSRA